ncbi:BTB POZ domain-containing KCTD21 [Brachionus plicatilis]|uniref:BTB POZ domain-containing KCTD21 n=1 Tax=Brachionus plicatilis TaxID=10195 RepID=A0A3M7QW61_BRAPC|nr:BTB POZ domain-containing KCTD21 [Brachionus plicatilis]
MFESLVDGFVKPKYDENKAIFIDRNPKYFGCILDYLRMANTDFEYELASSIDKNELLKEAKFYNIQGLVDLIETYFFDSIILNTEDSRKNLFKICEFPSKTRLNLLYRATTDGFSAQNFHSKCDHLKKTLTIIKTTGNYIFGGYTEQSWDGNVKWKDDPNAFIFSINNCIKAKVNPLYLSNAICCYSHYGPTFGGGHDIYISNDSNSSNQNQIIEIAVIDEEKCLSQLEPIENHVPTVNRASSTASVSSIYSFQDQCLFYFSCFKYLVIEDMERFISENLLHKNLKLIWLRKT